MFDSTKIHVGPEAGKPNKEKYQKFFFERTSYSGSFEKKVWFKEDQTAYVPMHMDELAYWVHHAASAKSHAVVLHQNVKVEEVKTIRYAFPEKMKKQLFPDAL